MTDATLASRRLFRFLHPLVETPLGAPVRPEPGSTRRAKRQGSPCVEKPIFGVVGRPVIPLAPGDLSE